MKEAAEISMGTEISEEDITNIRHLCVQVSLVQLFEQNDRLMSWVRIQPEEFFAKKKSKLEIPIIYDDVSYRPSLNLQVERSHTEIIGCVQNICFFFLHNSSCFLGDRNF